MTAWKQFCTLSGLSWTRWEFFVACWLYSSEWSGGPLQPTQSSSGQFLHLLDQTVVYQPSWLAQAPLPLHLHLFVLLFCPPLLLLFLDLLLWLPLLSLFLLLATMAYTELMLQLALHGLCTHTMCKSRLITLAGKRRIYHRLYSSYHQWLTLWEIVDHFSANKSEICMQFMHNFILR